LILQTLDIKNNCAGAFINDILLIEPSIEDMEKCNLAWKYSPTLNDEKYTYLYVLNRGEELSNYSSDPSAYLSSEERIKAHHKAALTAKVDASDSCFFDMVPNHQLKDYFINRYHAMANLSEKVPIPKDYGILHKIHVISEKIRKQGIQYRGQIQSINYDIFGTATGRLTTKKSSLPILTLKREDRVSLTPSNDLFVELDFNAAEVRMLLALSGKSQPSGDIHLYLEGQIFKKSSNRDKFKEKLFAWLYNPNSQEDAFNSLLDKSVYLDFYDTEHNILETPFSRKLKVDERKALNYLLQSSTSDQVLENTYRIQKILENKRSKVSFTLHDSVVLDMAKEDAKLLPEIKRLFEQTRWGRFMSTCKVGKNFGELKDIEI